MKKKRKQNGKETAIYNCSQVKLHVLQWRQSASYAYRQLHGGKDFKVIMVKVVAYTTWLFKC